jgi:hypothetical protein
MATMQQLVAGLGGAIGCDFRRAQNQLVFVEYNGKLSRLNLFRTATVISSGTTPLKGTYTFDLDTGTEGGVGPQFDVWWEQQTALLRRMDPINGAQLINLGVVDFNSITRILWRAWRTQPLRLTATTMQRTGSCRAMYSPC